VRALLKFKHLANVPPRAGIQSEILEKDHEYLHLRRAFVAGSASSIEFQHALGSGGYPTNEKLSEIFSPVPPDGEFG